MPFSIHQCGAPSAAAEQAAITEEARDLGFSVQRQIGVGQATLILTKKIQGKEMAFKVTGMQDWKIAKAAAQGGG